MMEFLIFLNSKEKEILELISKAQYSVEENTPLCLLGTEFFGFLKKEKKTIVICTENAKKYGGFNFSHQRQDPRDSKTGIYIRRALRHEAVHVAQNCNGGELLDLGLKKKLIIHPYKIEALKGSTSVSGSRSREYQAYSMEDKPRLIINSLKKYCF